MDVPAPGVGAVCGSCPNGYTGDASKCYGWLHNVIIIILRTDTVNICNSDIDECESDANLCDQVCENTEGSFFCTCTDGYQLVGDNQCQGMCSNLIIHCMIFCKLYCYPMALILYKKQT